MAGSECPRVRLWRWRRSPLKRRSDVIEAWVVLCGWVFALVAAVFAGLGAAGAVERSAVEQRARSHEVSAVLAEDSKDSAPANVTTDQRVWAAVRWTAPDGSTRTDQARVPPKTKAGAKVTVWVDEKGAVTNEPLSRSETLLHSIAGGVLAGAGAGGLVLGSVWGVRLGLERRRLAQWAAEWERIDTRWGWKTG